MGAGDWCSAISARRPFSQRKTLTVRPEIAATNGVRPLSPTTSLETLRTPSGVAERAPARAFVSPYIISSSFLPTTATATIAASTTTSERISSPPTRVRRDALSPMVAAKSPSSVPNRT
eukprot:Amastigsp_a847530_4.p4 type:complete len:119 gc:universal Amastigsp_a847530_4:611-967(+)